MAKALGIAAIPASWNESWAGYREWLRGGGCWPTDGDTNPAEVFDLPAECMEALEEVRRAMWSNQPLQELVRFWHYLVYHLPGGMERYTNVWNLPDIIGGFSNKLLQLAAIVSGADHAVANFAATGVSQDVAIDYARLHRPLRPRHRGQARRVGAGVDGMAELLRPRLDIPARQAHVQGRAVRDAVPCVREQQDRRDRRPVRGDSQVSRGRPRRRHQRHPRPGRVDARAGNRRGQDRRPSSHTRLRSARAGDAVIRRVAAGDGAGGRDSRSPHRGRQQDGPRGVHGTGTVRPWSSSRRTIPI